MREEIKKVIKTIENLNKINDFASVMVPGDVTDDEANAIETAIAKKGYCLHWERRGFGEEAEYYDIYIATEEFVLNYYNSGGIWGYKFPDEVLKNS